MKNLILLAILSLIGSARACADLVLQKVETSPTASAVYLTDENANDLPGVTEAVLYNGNAMLEVVSTPNMLKDGRQATYVMVFDRSIDSLDSMLIIRLSDGKGYIFSIDGSEIKQVENIPPDPLAAPMLAP